MRKQNMALAAKWFRQKNWSPHKFQKETWQAIASGKSGLLNAPTGYGKTYAMWFGILERLLASRASKEVSRGTYCLWLTPLRSLSQEMFLALNRVNQDLSLGLDIALRTGDTAIKERQRQAKEHPDVLITTPESVHLMLAQKGYAKRLNGIRFVVVDEWHELLGSKRGVLTELALSRLKQLNPTLQIWGISATIGNLEEAKNILLGTKETNNGCIVRANLPKKTEITTIMPEKLDKFPWAGHLGVYLAPEVIKIIEHAGTCLIFTNTRSQAEIWYRELLKLQPNLAGILALHHGSLSEEIRQWVEQSLHLGKLKAVVCTSSLDLGVDFRPVDTVVQIGSAKGIARFLQRAGRSGHQPGATSKIWFLPTHSLEIIEGAALRYAENHQLMENRIPYIRSFDVLIQYLVTLAVSDGFYPMEIFNEVKQTHCFASISMHEFNQCLLLITQGGKTLDAYDEFHKVVIENGLYKVISRKIAMRHRLSIGAIVSDTMMSVKYPSGRYIGSIEEWFISRLHIGDTFWFAGKNLELIRVKDLQAIVRLSNRKKGIVPSWMGGRLPLSTHLSMAIRHMLDEWQQNTPNTMPEMTFLRPLFKEQERRSALPSGESFVIEKTQTKEGYHLFFYPFEGKFVHEGMAALFAHRLSLHRPYTFSIAMNDYGFELLSDQEIQIEEAISNGLLSTENLSTDIQQSVNMTEMARKRFRDIAGIAGLVFQGFPERKIKTKHLQANAGLFFKVFEEYEPENLLLREAYDEVFDFQLDYARLHHALNRISMQKILIKHPSKLTPFAFPIFAESFRERFSNEALEDRLNKIIAQL
ncbi:ligase-associated DNA damage response DEXH box helicase [Olivibacter sp. SDN3]|uniref:ligase-associated DNA damage response DEXH box helicase n=1 Tax=Olivibacter sp. SDN3 TaxID=2764720 RepID=UPI00165107EF|nr:ligase-associated DNA damage response DEXH box helicase [Olivibacter sp. SDN3]QNL50846.1 ligase-associated DNA damage response DEXH box helicase [Olivibacter sp. SDN3]